MSARASSSRPRATSRRRGRRPPGIPRRAAVPDACEHRAGETPRRHALVARDDGLRDHHHRSPAPAAARNRGARRPRALPRDLVRDRQLPAELPARLHRHDGDLHAAQRRRHRRPQSLPQGLARRAGEVGGRRRPGGRPLDQREARGQLLPPVLGRLLDRRPGGRLLVRGRRPPEPGLPLDPEPHAVDGRGDIQGIVSRLQARGYETSRLVRTLQVAAPASAASPAPRPGPG